MLVQRLVGQPGTATSRERNVDAIADLIAARATRFDAAIAYVTDSGVDALLSAITSRGVETEWSGIDKRFLVSCDWFRSDPTALRRIASLPARVRVHDGKRVVARTGCVPFTPWHPKWFAIHGPAVHGHFCGSGNLSRNGLLNGHEAGLLQMVQQPSNKAEHLVESSIKAGIGWFDRNWRRATPLNDVVSDYEKAFTSQPKTFAGRNDDTSDSSGRVGRRYGLSADQLAALTSGTNFWLEGGTLSRNRGPGRPGNQLMMSALMRVFFGAKATEVNQNTAVARPTIEHPTQPGVTVNAPIRFSDNSMDVISLPVPESPWPSSYDDMTLLFTKVARGSSLHYILTVRTRSGSKRWRAASSAQGTSYTMRSGRQWGIFK
jgi:hypothetical protein